MHFSQRAFTEALTFMIAFSLNKQQVGCLLRKADPKLYPWNAALVKKASLHGQHLRLAVGYGHGVLEVRR